MWTIDGREISNEDAALRTQLNWQMNESIQGVIQFSEFSQKIYK